MNDLSIIDALTQHQAYLYRLSSQNVNESVNAFNRYSNSALAELSSVLNELSDAELKALAGGQYTTPQLKQVKSIVDAWMASVSVEVQASFATSALALAIYEAEYQAKLLGETVEIKESTLKKAYSKTPYAQGQLIDLIFPSIAESLREKVLHVIRDGVNQGQSNQQIVQRIKGRKANNYTDGLLYDSRRNIETEVRTARSHISNRSYLETYSALGFEYLRFVATLDGRTSKTCAYYSDRVYKIGDNHPTPPLHRNCRSVLVGVDKDGKLQGERPFVADKRKVKDIPKSQREGKIGQVDANTTFKDWFAKQDDDFQKGWLGASKYKLYKDGGYKIEKFVDPLTNEPFTLAELRAKDESTFKRLGL